MGLYSGFSGNAGTRMKDVAKFPLGVGLVDGDHQQPQGPIRNLSVTEVLASRRRVLSYLLSRYRGALRDVEFDAQNLNELGLCSLDFVEILLALADDRKLSIDLVGAYLARGDEYSRHEALLLKRVLALAVSFSAAQRYIAISSGVIDNEHPLAPFRPPHDTVAALEGYCSALDTCCRM